VADYTIVSVNICMSVLLRKWSICNCNALEDIASRNAEVESSDHMYLNGIGCILHSVLNGRTLCDLQSNYTCYTHIGASVADYTIVSENAPINILYYTISEFNPTLSDCHCKLEWEMSANHSVTPTSSEECSMHHLQTSL
jgi:hypothetical protein